VPFCWHQNFLEVAKVTFQPGETKVVEVGPPKVVVELSLQEAANLRALLGGLPGGNSALGLYELFDELTMNEHVGHHERFADRFKLA
jgi:hypothetical protein